jgi:hypothetical protein
METEISKETLDRVREVLKGAGFTKEQIADIEKGIKKLAVDYPVAAGNFAHWLAGKGAKRYLRPAWLRLWQTVLNAEERTRGYFLERTLPRDITNFERRESLTIGAVLHCNDQWDGKIEAAYPREAGLYFASANSCLTSHGAFSMTVEEDPEYGKWIRVKGRVCHVWWDTYHWTKGKTFPLPGIGRVSDEQMEKLKDAGAMDYSLESWWLQTLQADYFVGMLRKVVPSKTKTQWSEVSYNEDGTRKP